MRAGMALEPTTVVLSSRTQQKMSIHHQMSITSSTLMIFVVVMVSFTCSVYSVIVSCVQQC